MGTPNTSNTHKTKMRGLCFKLFIATALIISTNTVYSRRIAEAGFKDDINEIKQQALDLGSKGLQFLGKAFEKTSTHVEDGLGHLENAGKTVVDVGKEIGEMGKGLFETGKEIFEKKLPKNNEIRNILNLADNQEFGNEGKNKNDDTPSFLKPLENIPWGGLKFNDA